MVKRVAKEWLWMLGAAIAAIALTLVDRGDWWRVGETGVLFVSMYGLSVLVRTTVWAVRTVRAAVTASD